MRRSLVENGLQWGSKT